MSASQECVFDSIIHCYNGTKFRVVIVRKVKQICFETMDARGRGRGRGRGYTTCNKLPTVHNKPAVMLHDKTTLVKHPGPRVVLTESVSQEEKIGIYSLIFFFLINCFIE